MTWISWTVLGGGIALTLLGLRLVRTGLWPRRVGRTLHCPKCDYVLTGLIEKDEHDDPSYWTTMYEPTGDRPAEPPVRCPECGTRVSTRTALRGGRPNRKLHGYIGLVVLLVGLLLVGLRLSGYLRHVAWYQVKPTSWVIDDLRSKEPLGARDAWVEIKRRLDANQFPESQRIGLDRAMVDVLAVYQDWSQPLFDGYLRDRFLQLDPETRRKLFDQLLTQISGPYYLTAAAAEGWLEGLISRDELSLEEHRQLANMARKSLASRSALPGYAFLSRYLREHGAADRLPDNHRRAAGERSAGN